MATFIFDTDNPYAAQVLAAVIQQFRENPELEVTENEKGIEIKGIEEDYLSPMLPGKPMSEELLLSRLMKSEQDYANGKSRSVDDILAEVKSRNGNKI